MRQITRLFFYLLCTITPLSIFAQTGIIEGRVANKLNNEPLPLRPFKSQGQPKARKRTWMASTASKVWTPNCTVSK